MPRNPTLQDEFEILRDAGFGPLAELQLLAAEKRRRHSRWSPSSSFDFDPGDLHVGGHGTRSRS